MTQSKPNQSIPHPLLTDLLDHALALPEVARRHDMPLPEIARILESPAFAEAAAAFARAVEIRAGALRPLANARALAAACRVMNQEITSAARAESVRKAVGMVLRWQDGASPEPDAGRSPSGAASSEDAVRPGRAGRPDGAGFTAEKPAGRMDPRPGPPSDRAAKPLVRPSDDEVESGAAALRPGTSPAAQLQAAAGEGPPPWTRGIGSLRLEELEALVKAGVPAAVG
ncbi:MAG: hypothetical protein LAT64_14515 [Phycisphaerales bacterium]|nr:hypothetical protein [Planctomycetota bacterium]MCH8509961.1 hypothetical protein [Phycisphaerales bacterium]